MTLARAVSRAADASARRLLTVTSAAACRFRPGLVLLAALLAAPADGAQSVTGTILGVVRDATGAGVPGARLTLTHASTGYARAVDADAEGNFAAPLLPPGEYTLVAAAEGFRNATVTAIQLGVDQKARVDVTLALGELAEAVVVTAGNPLAQPAATDLSAAFDERRIQDLPLNGRNFVPLVRTAPGIVRGVPGENIDGASGVSWRHSASFTVNGQRTRDNTFLLDGLDNNEVWLNSVAIFPNVDALEEIKVQTGIYPAEFGRALGGVVSLHTRAGSNVLRGSAFEFFRDDRFDANDWFNARADRPKPDHRHHQFGGTAGGPLVRNRTFFFGSYQGWRIDQDLTLVSTVPTAAMRTGDFSALNLVIYDPATGQPFPGNVIPDDRLHPTSRRIVERLYPLPNAAGRQTASGQVIDNYVANPAQTRRDHQVDVRVDHAFGEANRAFVRVSRHDAAREIPPALPEGDGGSTGAGTYDIAARSVAFNDTHVFGPRWINELRIGWNGIDTGFARFGHRRRLADEIGIAGINLDDRTSGMPAIHFATQDMRSVGTGGVGQADTSALQVTDSVTVVRGRHTVKAGGSLILWRRLVDLSDTPLGLFGHTPGFTSGCAGARGPCAADPATGFSFASFLLGHPFIFARSLLAAPYTETRPEWSAYAQDDFRGGRRVTLNLGLRWDVFVPYVADGDRQSNFDASTGTFVVASKEAVIDGLRVGRRLQTYSKANVAPRLGLAWDAAGDGRTIVRGGFGVFWNTPLTGTASAKGQNPPFLLSQFLTNPSPFVPELGYVSAAVPPSPVTGGNTRSSFDPRFRDGYAQQWSLNAQQQIGRDHLVELGYVGTRGRQLVVLVDANQAPAREGVTNPNVNRPFFGVNPALGSVIRSTSRGTLDYHALQARVVRRLAKGLSFTQAYTFGKAIDLDSDTDGFTRFPDAYNLESNRGPASYDVTHVFTSNWVYELPFGGGGRLGGWQVSGLLLARSGYPFTVFQPSGPLSTLTAAPPGQIYRPDRIAPGTVGHPTIDRWFAVEDFVPTSEPTAAFGNSGRNILRGPGQFTIDAALSKRTRIGPAETELRVEAFNLLNRPVFANPASTIGSATAGTITSLMPFTPMRQVQLAVKARF